MEKDFLLTLQGEKSSRSLARGEGRLFFRLKIHVGVPRGLFKFRRKRFP